MNKIVSYVILGTILPINAMDDDNLKNKKLNQQSISRAQSFILGKPFKAVGDEFVMYPHYLNDQHEEYYLERRGTALTQLQRLKEKNDIDHFSLVQMRNRTVNTLRQINLEQKLILQLSEDELLNSCASFLDNFDENFEADEKDFGSDEQIKWTHTNNRKKFYDLLKSDLATKNEINAAAQAPFGTQSLLEFYAKYTAAIFAVQAAMENQQLNVLEICDFMYLQKIYTEEEQQRFLAKYKEMSEKLEKNRLY